MQNMYIKMARIQEKQWEHICKAIGSMESLLKLRVTVYDTRAFIIRESELLRPLMKIDVEDFVVQLPWSLSVAWDVMKVRVVDKSVSQSSAKSDLTTE